MQQALNISATLLKIKLGIQQSKFLAGGTTEVKEPNRKKTLKIYTVNLLLVCNYLFYNTYESHGWLGPCYTRHCGLKNFSPFSLNTCHVTVHSPLFYFFFNFNFCCGFKGFFLTWTTSVKLGGSELEFRSESKWPKWKAVGADFMW